MTTGRSLDRESISGQVSSCHNIGGVVQGVGGGGLRVVDVAYGAESLGLGHWSFSDYVCELLEHFHADAVRVEGIDGASHFFSVALDVDWWIDGSVAGVA